MIPAAPPQDRRKRAHSMTVVRLARQMYGDGDSWTPTQIRDYLDGRGLAPGVAVATVRYWVVPGEAEVQTRRNRESYHRRKQARDRWRIRMVELRTEVGLTCSSIARLLRHDLGVEITDGQVRAEVGHLPRGSA